MKPRIVFYAIMVCFDLMMMVPKAWSGEEQQQFDKAGETPMKQSKQYFVRLLGTREGWPEAMSADEEKIMEEHYQYLVDLVKQHKVRAAGPVFDPVFGLVILDVENEAEARQIMDKEPSVVAGVHTYELSEMRLSLQDDYISPDRHVQEMSDRILRKEVTVAATIDDVWSAWTTTTGVKSFFSPNARVELRVGGAYEIYFSMEAPEGQRGSEDCRVLSWLPKEMLTFEWNAPPSFGALRGRHTRVIMQFTPIGEDEVRVVLSQVGWGRGEAWDDLYAYFDRAWGYVLSNFQKSCSAGPLDWTSE